MAGLDTEFTGEARAADGIKRGYLEQEPQLDPALNVRQNVEGLVRGEAVGQPLQRGRRRTG